MLQAGRGGRNGVSNAHVTWVVKDSPRCYRQAGEGGREFPMLMSAGWLRTALGVTGRPGREEGSFQCSCPHVTWVVNRV